MQDDLCQCLQCRFRRSAADMLKLLMDIEAEWPATTSVLRERGRALIAEAEAMDNDRIDDARI